MPGWAVTMTPEELAASARRSWWLSLLRGVLAILFGIVALVAPIATAVVLAIFIGAYAIVDGVVDIVAAVRYRRSVPMALRTILGVVSLLFGVTVLIWPGPSLTVLVVMVAVWAIVVGILEIIASVGSRDQHRKDWIWGVVSGGLWVLLGVFALINPGAGVVALVWTVALWALLFGVVLIVIGIQLRKIATTV